MNAIDVEELESGDGGYAFYFIQFISSHGFLDFEFSILISLTHNKDWFNTYMLVYSGSILMGNNASCKIIEIENIIIKLFDGIVRMLCDVRHILDLKKNLISFDG